LLAAQAPGRPEGRWGWTLRTDSHLFSVGFFSFAFHLQFDRDGWIIMGLIAAAKTVRRRESSWKPSPDWPANQRLLMGA